VGAAYGNIVNSIIFVHDLEAAAMAVNFIATEEVGHEKLALAIAGKREIVRAFGNMLTPSRTAKAKQERAMLAHLYKYFLPDDKKVPVLIGAPTVEGIIKGMTQFYDNMIFSREIMDQRANEAYAINHEFAAAWRMARDARLSKMKLAPGSNYDTAMLQFYGIATKLIEARTDAVELLLFELEAAKGKPDGAATQAGIKKKIDAMIKEIVKSDIRGSKAFFEMFNDLVPALDDEVDEFLATISAKVMRMQETEAVKLALATQAAAGEDLEPEEKEAYRAAASQRLHDVKEQNKAEAIKTFGVNSAALDKIMAKMERWVDEEGERLAKEKGGRDKVTPEELMAAVGRRMKKESGGD
jgi:hypothetical protein